MFFSLKSHVPLLRNEGKVGKWWPHAAITSPDYFGMKWSIGKGATAAFALTATVLLGFGWLSFHSLQVISSNERLVDHTHEVLETLRTLSREIIEAEDAQRGYLVTSGPDYLDLHRSALAAIPQSVARLKTLTSDNPAQQARISALEQTVTARLEKLQQGMNVHEAQGFEAARQFTQIGEGKQLMDSIRTQVAEIEATENHLLSVRQLESHASYRSAMLTLTGATLIGLGLVITGYGLVAREVQTRSRGAEALASANELLEQRVEQRTADLAATNEALRRSNRELEQFASVASHDLQEPLRKIQAFGDRLQTKCSANLGDQGREYLQRMQASATRMRHLIDALLTFSRVTTKAQPFVPVDLAVTAEDVISDLEDRIHRSGGRIDIGSLPTLDADPLQMRQLFQNLLGNGLKFHRAEVPPVVGIDSRIINQGNGEATVEYCEIAVRDNGIGFDEVYLDRIFELFQRLHSRQEYEGTGLGLAICRKIVERHHGRITATSAPNQGATFLITLPMRQQ